MDSAVYVALFGAIAAIVASYLTYKAATAKASQEREALRLQTEEKTAEREQAREVAERERVAKERQRVDTMVADYYEALSSDYRALQERLSRAEQQLSENNGTIVTLTREVERLTQENAAKDAEIAQLRRRNDALQAEIVDLRARLSKYDGEVSRA